MRRRSILAGLMFLGVSAFGAVITVPGDKPDNSIGKNAAGALVLGYAAQQDLEAGDDNATYNKDDQCAVVVFRLPNLNGQAVSNANLTANMYASLPGGTDPFPKGVDLYGIRYSSNSTVVTNDYGFKGSGPGTLIQNNVMTMTNSGTYGRAPYETDDGGDAALASWLNVQYAAGARTGDFVFLRYELDGNTANPIKIASADSTNNTPPVLTLFTGAGTTEAPTISLTQFGITWTISGTNQTGQYANGDYWIVGPVTITSIGNSFHTNGFSPAVGNDGSMINPRAGPSHGYDSRQGGYSNLLNRYLVGGAPVSSTNPLVLPVNSSLISSVSWLYTVVAGVTNTESGCPKFDGATGQPRPTTRSMAILTCVSNVPPAGSFRPPYCGTNKAARFNKNQLDYSKLGSLIPAANAPALTNIEANFTGPWVDHVTTWNGAALHPDSHMPNYGRDLSIEIGEAAVMLQMDFSQLPGNPSKEKLLVEFTQLGIDLAGVADTGGNWHSDGGHFMGRKFPILFAGTVLNDAHMKSVGSWTNKFQEDQDTFYVEQTNVDITHNSTIWRPDYRAPSNRYEVVNIGLPEWGIRHETFPERDNLNWAATYRLINNQSYAGWALAANIMGLRTAWNHDALFDYIDRSTEIGNPPFNYDADVFGTSFVRAMWKAYRINYPPRWVPYNPANLYSSGRLVYPETGFLFQLNTLP
jgi:hypothetical protein